MRIVKQKRCGFTPRYVRVEGLEPSWKVELYLGNTSVGKATADANGIARLSVIANLIETKAKIFIKDPQDNTIVEKASP